MLIYSLLIIKIAFIQLTYMYRKKDNNSPQREYDLYEEYFKYPIDIKEYRHEGGRRLEISKADIRMEYKRKMTDVYDRYKEIILLFVEPEYV